MKPFVSTGIAMIDYIKRNQTEWDENMKKLDEALVKLRKRIEENKSRKARTNEL